MAETFVAFTVVMMLTWRVVRAVRLSGGLLRLRGLDPWVF